MLGRGSDGTEIPANSANPGTFSLPRFYRSAKSGAWEPVELFEWRGGTTPRIHGSPELYDGRTVIKREVLPDGRHKLILKDEATGDFEDRVIAGG